jgi:hypothetical protein
MLLKRFLSGNMLSFWGSIHRISVVNMSHKSAYLWGPVSSFSAQLAAFLVQKGWHVHVATKSAFHFALSPLDLKSTAQASIEKALGGADKYKIFEDRFRFLDVNEVSKGTKYDAFVFCGLPTNFDEPRVSRAPWAAENFQQIARKFKGAPVFIVSSLWGAVQNDGVVPEEIECERRKPLSPFEAVCQQYENRLLKTLGTDETQWYLVRLPMLSGSTADGQMVNFTGPMTLFNRIAKTVEAQNAAKKKTATLEVQYNPDATMWFLPVDVAVHYFWRLLEDEQRPRITNLVSTQATLNQEWMQHLAKALEYSKAVHVDSDDVSLPGVLRSALNDNILVKTRGLFEVMGRYQQVPIVIDQAYFCKVFEFGRSENWGKIAESSKNGSEAVPKETACDAAEVASFGSDYFTKFVPSQVDSTLLKEIGPNTAIGVSVEGNDSFNWVLKAQNGQVVVEPAADQHPGVRFNFTPNGLMRLAQRKVSLERALVQREAKVEGNPMEILRACNFLKKLWNTHPYEAGKNGSAPSSNN